MEREERGRNTKMTEMVHYIQVAKSLSTMKFWAVVIATHSLVGRSDAYSLYDPAKARAPSQKSVVQQTMGITRRETIRKPSTPPMVPYMVRTNKATIDLSKLCLHLLVK
jgi:hypothetical protein